MSWSGGKDSAIALDELLRAGDYDVVSLMTTVSEEYRRISHHGVREALLDEQARAIGVPLEKVYLPSGESGGCTNEVYEGIMSRVMNGYKARGVETVGFGDLFLEDLRAWREANLAKAGMRGIFPIWKRNTTKVAHEVIHDAPGVAARQQGLASGPVAPVVAEDRLFLLLGSPVVGIGLGEGQPQRLFVMAQNQRMGDEALPGTDRTKALIVEIIRDAIHAHLLQGLFSGGQLSRA